MSRSSPMAIISLMPWVVLLGRRVAAKALRIVEGVNVFAGHAHGGALELEQPGVAGLLVGGGVWVRQRVLHDEIEEALIGRHRNGFDAAVRLALGDDRRQ